MTATISYQYDASDVVGTEAAFNVLRSEAGTTTVYTGGTVNAVTHTATAPGVTNFSLWGAGLLAPSAANASLSGRVMTAGGNGISNVRVVISGNNLPQPLVTRTSSFGYFGFDNLETGETYIVTVNSKRFVFTQPSRIVTLNDSIDDFDFISEP